MQLVYFASGSNAPGEIRGIASIGKDVGVAVQSCPARCRAALLKAAVDFPSLNLFVDSGAFSEVSTEVKAHRKAGLKAEKGVLKTVKPISDKEWRRRLGIMLELAEAYGPRALVVAPDKIADQRATLDRLKRYRKEVRAIAATGAHVAVVLQGGPMGPIEFDRAVAKALGWSGYTVAWPMQKAWTPVDVIRDFMGKRLVRRVHLLGIGPEARGTKAGKPAAAELRRLFKAYPRVAWSWDSCLICRSVGRKGYVRPYTAAQDIERGELAAEAFQSNLVDPYTGQHFDWTEAAPDPAVFLEDLWKRPALDRALQATRRGKPTAKKAEKLKKARDTFYRLARATAREAGLRGAVAKAFIRDPNRFVHERDDEGIERWERSPQLQTALDSAYTDWVGTQTVQLRKERAAVRAFKPKTRRPPAKQRGFSGVA